MTLALVLSVPGSESELAADALWALGVQAVEERTRADTDDGMVELWTSLGDDIEHITREADAFPARWRWRIVEVDDDVIDTWRAHAGPSWITPELVVVPDWLDERDDLTDGEALTVIRIDPGATFGLGDHPSTVLALRALQAVLWPGATVLDVGCGSGVLGVAAARSGATYVEALDISADAVATTMRNADRNGVAGRISASTRPLADVVGLHEPQPRTFDVVVANVLAPVLIDLADGLRAATASDGVLVISGVLSAAHGHVVEALAPMQVVDRLTREGWTSLVLRH